MKEKDSAKAVASHSDPSSLLDFMHERQRIFLHRQAGKPFPWTADALLGKYHFENIYRPQDRQSRWLTENWLLPYAEHDNLWFACCLFRQINWSPTLEEIGFPEEWNPDRVHAVLARRQARGEKLYSPAYRFPSRDDPSRPRTTVYRVLDRLWRAQYARYKWNRPPWEGTRQCTLETAHKWLSCFHGFGGSATGFLSFEAITDMRHTRYLRNASDINTWANTGPGAARGICRIIGVDPKTKIPAVDQLRHMREIYRWVDEHRDRTILPTLEMRDIETSLCCWQKWMTAREDIAAGRKVRLRLFHPPEPPEPPRLNLFGDPIPQRPEPRPRTPRRSSPRAWPHTGSGQRPLI